MMTFSIIGYDPQTGDFGVAVQSKFISVGAVVPWAEANVGAVATQSFCNTTFGPRGLKLMKEGYSAQEVLKELLKDDEEKESRQVALINKDGAAAFTGKECFYWAGQIIGKNYSVQGNILTKKETIEAMAKAFEETIGDLADKLIAALLAADKEGLGDARGKQSASLLVVRDKGGYGGFTDRYIDIRVDEHEEPIKELARVLSIYDMTFLRKEDKSSHYKIEGDIAFKIKEILVELKYLKSDQMSKDDQWDENEKVALENWIGMNNFENKHTDPNRIYNSVYQYMIKNKGTPYFDLKKMYEN